MLASDEELRRVVQGKLELDWSPQQIAVWLRMEYPQRPEWHVCHKTTYQSLHQGRPARGGSCGAAVPGVRSMQVNWTVSSRIIDR